MFLKKKINFAPWFLFLFLSSLLFLTRFLNLRWGNGFFFHPDEANMARGVSQMRADGLNPHFYAYGQFPLFLTYFSGIFWTRNLLVSFPNAVYLLRFWSAIFSIMSVLIGWLLAKEIFGGKNWTASLYCLLLTFSPGLIQFAHFGTTESIMIFSALAIAYFSIKFFKSEDKKFIIYAGFVFGLALATKLNAVLFVFAPLVSIVMTSFRQKQTSLFKKRKLSLIIEKLLIFSFVSFCLFVTLSPFSIINFRDFYSTIHYEAKVASGEIQVFYTRQFIDTTPIVFQLKKIFPWVLGLPLFVFLLVSLSVSGLWTAGLIARKKFKFKIQNSWFIIHISWLPWFLFNSFLFAKWTRFMVPATPFLILTAVYFFKIFLEKSRERRFLTILFYSLLFFSLLPGLIYLNKVYGGEDIRVSADEWINDNLLGKSVILTESGNVVDLPILNRNNFRIINIDFYHLDEDERQQRILDDALKETDYIIIPSRRIFANHLKLEGQFPITANYYENLFSGQLDFRLIKQFSPFSKWEEFLLGSDLNSEETWTVFDHPTIRIFAREAN